MWLLKRITNGLPQQIIERCIFGMMPNGIAKKSLAKRLKVYQGSQHPHNAQNPIYIDDIDNLQDEISIPFEPIGQNASEPTNKESLKEINDIFVVKDSNNVCIIWETKQQTKVYYFLHICHASKSQNS